MNVICRCFVFVPVVPPCFTFAFASPWSWHLSHFVVPFFFLFLLLFFFSCGCFYFYFYYYLCFPRSLCYYCFPFCCCCCCCCAWRVLFCLFCISFDLIIILSRHDRKPPTRHSCPPSKAIASPFHFYSHSPSPSLLRHNNRNRVNIEQVFSGAICIPLPRQPPLRVRAR